MGAGDRVDAAGPAPLLIAAPDISPAVHPDLRKNGSMTNAEKQALETVTLFAIQHLTCGLVEQTYKREQGEAVTIYARCPSCGAATNATSSVSALSEQLRASLQGS
jgi:hypothetical protein